MTQITDTLRDSRRLRLIATALELMQYELTDSAVIPIPGTEPQRYVTIGTAETVARLLEIAPAAQEVTQQAAKAETAELADAEKPMPSPLYYKALPLVHETGKASVSMVQRIFAISYADAENLIDLMVLRGDVSYAMTSGLRLKPKQSLAPTTSTVSAPEEVRDAAILRQIVDLGVQMHFEGRRDCEDEAVWADDVMLWTEGDRMTATRKAVEQAVLKRTTSGKGDAS